MTARTSPLQLHANSNKSPHPDKILLPYQNSGRGSSPKKTPKTEWDGMENAGPYTPSVDRTGVRFPVAPPSPRTAHHCRKASPTLAFTWPSRTRQQPDRQRPLRRWHWVRRLNAQSQDHSKQYQRAARWSLVVNSRHIANDRSAEQSLRLAETTSAASPRTRQANAKAACSPPPTVIGASLKGKIVEITVPEQQRICQ